MVFMKGGGTLLPIHHIFSGEYSPFADAGLLQNLRQKI
jgi:hypothetical protein